MVGSAGRQPLVVAELAEGVGELVAQPLVLVSEFAVAAVGQFKTLAQGVIASALLGGYRRAGLVLALVAEPTDLVFDVGLGVDPGAGYSGVASDGLEGEHGTGSIELMHRCERLGAGVFVALFGGGGEVNAVVSPHVWFLSTRRGR
jgi:hypothetical protein